MPFTGGEKKTFYVSDYNRTPSNQIVQRAFWREFANPAPIAAQIWTQHK